MHKQYLKLDFFLQLFGIALCLFTMSIFNDYIYKSFLFLAIVQSVSIIYHCLINKTTFSQLRNWHTGATCGILIFIFIMYFSATADIDIFGEAVISLLFIIAVLSIILTILYTIISYHSYKDTFENNKN